VRGAVVLDGEAALGVEKVNPRHETTGRITKVDLRLRPWQPGEHQTQPQASLHRALCLSFSELDGSPEFCDAPITRVFLRPTLELVDVDFTFVERGVEHDHSLDKFQATGKVDDRTKH